MVKRQRQEYFDRYDGPTIFDVEAQQHIRPNHLTMGPPDAEYDNIYTRARKIGRYAKLASYGSGIYSVGKGIYSQAKSFFGSENPSKSLIQWEEKENPDSSALILYSPKPQAMDVDRSFNKVQDSVTKNIMPYYNSRKRRFPVRRRRKYKRGRNSAKRIKAIAQRQAALGPTTHVEQYDTGYFATNANECNHAAISAFTRADCDQMLEFYAGRHLQHAATTGQDTYESIELDYDATYRPYDPVKMFFTKGAVCRYTIRNNDKVACYLTAYEFACVDDTTIQPLTEYDNITEQERGQTVASVTNFQYNINRFKSKFKHWKVLKTGKVLLDPGQEIVVRIKPGRGWYDSQYYGSQANSTTYLKGISKQLVLRLDGTLGHDTTTRANVGRLKVAVDYETFCVWKFRLYRPLHHPNNTYSQAVDTITVGEQSHVAIEQEQPE